MIKAVIFDFFGVLELEWQPNQELLNYIKSDLKPKYKLGIISNAAADFIYEILPKEDTDLFDDIILSHRAGVAKPEAAIYEMSADNLKVRADQCVFVDDIEDFCGAARGMGMHAVRYKSFGQMKTDLEKLLIANADN